MTIAKEAVLVTGRAPRRLLAAHVDAIAVTSPTQLFGLTPNGTHAAAGFREVNFEALCRAVNTMAWWLNKHLGKSNNETIAYLGCNDIRYIVLMLACHKTNYTLFLPSTRLANDAYNHVLHATQTTRLLFSQEKKQLVSRLTGLSKAIPSLEIPSVAELFSDRDHTGHLHYDWTPSFEEMENRVAFAIHSSGTTGMPKPVYLTHGFLGTMDYGAFIPRPEGRSLSFFNDLASTDPDSKDLVLSVTPYFHLMGLVSFFESIFHNLPFVASPDQPLSVNFLIDILHHTRPTVTILPPSILEDMSESDEALACFSKLKFICYGGAPLAPEVGAKLNQYTQLRTPIGSTEMGVISSLVPQHHDDWGYFEWNPAYRVEMQDIGDELYELVIPRVENSRLMHGVFHTYPDLKEYRSKDLYVRHPHNPNLWRYHGRFDDVIVLSNGEKLNPISAEKVIEGHPSVHRALVIGQRRFQTCLLIEPSSDLATDAIDEPSFIATIWPLVQAANQILPEYGQIMKHMILLASPTKPFQLTPKGTTQRHAVNLAYTREIDAIYAAQDEQQVEVKLPAATDYESLRNYLQSIISSLTGRSQDLKDSDDLYTLGLDSMRVIQLSKTLGSSVKARNGELDIKRLNVQELYAHPTLGKLTYLLQEVLQEKTASIPVMSRAEKIAELVHKYTDDLPVRILGARDLPERSTVIVTGSTGSLGTYLLYGLLCDAQVAKVYCLNRTEDAVDRQSAGFAQKGLDTALLADKSRVEFLHTSFGERHFGLNEAVYRRLLDSVDMVIHNAWKVNFNHPVSTFEDPHIQSVREFINFSLESRYNTHIAFVSSISTVSAWKPSSAGESSVPEVPMETVDSTLEQGYGESKYIGERICVEASRRSKVPTSVLRVGQIAGPDSQLGLWNPHEWLPTIVKTSISMRQVPGELGSFVVDWVAVDTLAKITIEILHHRRLEAARSASEHAVFHLTNPFQAPWADLIPAIQKRYPVEVVSFVDWINALGSVQDSSSDDLVDKPALKLLDFYRAIAGGSHQGPILSVERSKEVSPTMASLGPVSLSQMSNWLNQWGF
ncbi:NRPS-like enzyme [Aspergillus eucalypticola CBS 122712]|uniref:NRPS-like enzyme n=1 Tax=Aspergillus eucalypticola (strain CBS 122712 / IBT 29274) TaxID=1448314 RepID=A0A317UVD9_ASPEC|nr:NRPS-like enzyme [Aspergillus eucalypticola CBS 122712]PWY65421.1 NRPS-like enzyme [Aspergillus eucalypticola CBS 122712]